MAQLAQLSLAGLAAASVVGAAVVYVIARRQRTKAAGPPVSRVEAVSPRARILATLGDPVNIVRTPLVFPGALARSGTGVDAVLVPLHVPPSALSIAFAALRAWPNLDGFVLTKPHKEEAARLCDVLTPEAQAVGAINVARCRADGRIEGHILDGVGFVSGLAACGHEVRGSRVLLVGAGGAARAIAFTLRSRGAASITVINRTAARAQALVEALALSPNVPVCEGACTVTALTSLPAGVLSEHYNIVVQCTSLGHDPEHDAWPIDPERLLPPLLCAEVIHTPLETPFLTAARHRGCAVHHGAHMLDQQIAQICSFLTVPSV